MAKGGGNADDPVREFGRRSDFIVIARPTAANDNRKRNGFFRAALLHSERPVLAVPPGHTTSFGRNVARLA
jgi:hypothetical protein